MNCLLLPTVAVAIIRLQVGRGLAEEFYFQHPPDILSALAKAQHLLITYPMVGYIFDTVLYWLTACER
jgi:hypothetical protein